MVQVQHRLSIHVRICSRKTLSLCATPGLSNSLDAGGRGRTDLGNDQFRTDDCLKCGHASAREYNDNHGTTGHRRQACVEFSDTYGQIYLVQTFPRAEFASASSFIPFCTQSRPSWAFLNMVSLSAKSSFIL